MEVEPGMKVVLVMLTKRPELNGTTATLQRYLDRRQMWAVRLDGGGVFAVKNANMRTSPALAQLPAFAELVEVRRDENGRYLVAARDIAKGTFAKTEKVHVVLSADELQRVSAGFEAFKEESVPRLLGVARVIFEHSHDLPHYASRNALFVGAFLTQRVGERPLVRELMDYDHLSPGYLKATLERLVLFDVLYFEYWRVQLEGRFSADEVWRAMSFLYSHAFLRDDGVLRLGLFCDAQCGEQRLAWYTEVARGGRPGALAGRVGNLQDVERGELAGDECVMFTKEVRQGAAVTIDFGPTYKTTYESQLRQFKDGEMRGVVDAVMDKLDERVRDALRMHYES